MVPIIPIHALVLDFQDLCNLVGYNLLRNTSQIKLYKTLIVPTTLHTSKTFTIKNSEDNKQDMFERTIFWRMLVYVQEDERIFRLRDTMTCVRATLRSLQSVKNKAYWVRWVYYANRQFINQAYHWNFNSLVYLRVLPERPYPG